MRKSTKKTIMSLVIILLFAMSTIAYVLVYVSKSNQQEDEIQVLDSFVIDYELNYRTEVDYIMRGYTIFKFYYLDQTDPIISYVQQLPNIFKSSSNQPQIIVEKLPSNDTYANIINYYINEDLANLTEDNIFDYLCDNVLSPPLECGLKQINYTA